MVITVCHSTNSFNRPIDRKIQPDKGYGVLVCGVGMVFHMEPQI